MMAETPTLKVSLVLGWGDLGTTTGLRRNASGFGTIKDLAQSASPRDPLKLNAFLYAFLCPAKNFDLFLAENMSAIAVSVRDIDQKIHQLSDFEREARTLPPQDLRETYLALRNVVARRTARDERRTLATLLFSGPSTAKQVADDLGIGENLVERVFRALAPVLERQGDERVALKEDTDTLATVLHLLRSTVGVDPLAVLQRRLQAQTIEGR